MIRELHDKLLRKEISSTEVVETFLARIQTENKGLNAFITQTPELALQQAKEVDAKIHRGEKLPLLAGIPCAIKDSILVKDVLCTAGSRILKNYIAPYDATVTRKLREQGALFVGKTNMDEFGMGGSTENSAFGVTKNPYDETRVAGGSSGGSAAAVSSDESVVALGEDTGGSIRLPASFCGVVGLKPTYGTVSRHGVIALASSLDQVGPFAKTVEDAEITFQVMCGKDILDATSLDYRYESLLNFNIQNLRVGIVKEFFGKGLMPEIAERIKTVIQKLEATGVTIEEVSLPHSKYALAAYYVLNASEVSSNLARFDGIRYGESVQSGTSDLLHVYTQTRGKYLGDEVKRRIILGTYALSAGYHDAYYLKAQKIRTLLQRDFDSAFEKVDVIMAPPSPFLPFKIGERTEDPLAMYLVDLYTVPVNLVGLPALSVPVGRVDNLPIGLQIIGKPLQENVLFATAKDLEKLTEMI